MITVLFFFEMIVNYRLGYVLKIMVSRLFSQHIEFYHKHREKGKKLKLFLLGGGGLNISFHNCE